MTSRMLLVIASFAAIAVQPASAAETFPQYSHLKRHRAAGENPYYHVNRYGYGNYVQGPNGAIGGYPAGSAGARELEINQELKCRFTPESC